jgi:hypothetical protein
MGGILYVTGALADGTVTTAKLAADAVTGAKIADDTINSEHYVDGSIDTAHIADQAVDLTKLPHGTSSNNGKFLRANNGADPTFEDVPAGGISNLVEDTTPQLGGDLQSNGNDIDFADNDKAIFGTGSDFEIYFDGTNGVLKGITGVQNINVWTENTAKYQFTAGAIRPLTNNSYDLGDSSLRWRNIYTNDLNLSNEGSSNDVDGTWGDWTIQEGESDLFLKNNRSGKMYKFNLTEVS